MSCKVRMSKLLASMRCMISPISRRRTPSPLTSTSVCSTLILLPVDVLFALHRSAVRAGTPAQVQRLLTVLAGLLEVPAALRAEEILLPHDRAATGAQVDPLPELPLQHGELKLSLLGVEEVLRRTYYKVDQCRQKRNEQGHGPPEKPHRPSASSVGEGPVRKREPQYHEA